MESEKKKWKRISHFSYKDFDALFIIIFGTMLISTYALYKYNSYSAILFSNLLIVIVFGVFVIPQRRKKNEENTA